KTNGTSASEKECALRRKRTWTTQTSAPANPAATAHHGSSGVLCGFSPCVSSSHVTPASTPSAITYAHVSRARDGRGMRRLGESSTLRRIGSCERFLNRHPSSCEAYDLGMSRLIRMDQTGHTTLAEWTTADAESVEAAVAALRRELDAGYYAVVSEGEGRARQVE